MRYAICNNKVVENIVDIPETESEFFEKDLPTGLTLRLVPDHVNIDWKLSENSYLAPEQAGWAYDYTDFRYYPHDKYRAILHERTSNDTLQALRKIREGDTSYDWQGWLAKLDAYNVAIEKIK